MAPRVRELFLQLLLIVVRQSAQVTSALVIEDGPSSLNISVNGQAAFRCVVSNAEVVLWFVNDSNIDNIKNLVEQQKVVPINNSSALEYNMFFSVDKSLTTLLNNSHIKCAGINLFHPFLKDESSSALLKIQGVLDAPFNISGYISTDSVNLSWLPPFTLAGIDINLYQVNMTARNSNDIIAQEADISVSENISFPVIDNSTCTVYNASIQARTEAGLGDAGETDRINKFEAPRKLQGNEIDIQVIFRMDNITLHFTIEQDICTGRQADTINATASYSTNIISSDNLPAEANDDGQITFELALPKSAKEATVFAVITLTNRVGSTDSEPVEKTIVSVQSVAFTDQGHVVNFECHFAKFSDAKGCYVILECASDISTEHKFNLSTRGSSDISEIGRVNCTQMTCAIYNVYAHDIKDDGDIGVKAWSEVNRTLCTTTLSTSTAHISPSASASPGPNNFDEIIIIIISALLFLALLIIACVVLALIIFWKCCKSEGIQLEQLEESVADTDMQAQPPGFFRKHSLDDEPR